jgi:CRISPR-associated protein Cmr3
MNTYLITPHAPLVLRKGKSTRGERADDSFLFPLPGTVAGMLRTAWADAENKEFGDAEKQACGGHLLARIKDGKIDSVLFPKPADAYYAKEGDKPKRLFRLMPGELPKDWGCDLPHDKLQPVFVDKNAGEAKSVDGPEWWDKSIMEQWLSGGKPEQVDELGAKAFPTDTRAHVKMDAQTRTGESGHLFRSSGVDLMNPRKEPSDDLDKRGWQKHRYGLLARFSQEIDDGLVRLGSGGRLSGLEKKSEAWWGFTDHPLLKPKLQQLKQGGKLRLILVTPAVFENGWLPDGIDKDTLEGEIHGVKLTLKAAALNRWQPLAGWDMAAKKYKPTRRMVPAGSVYWFEIKSEPPTDWAEKLWLTSICGKDHNDGFGLVVPGVWIEHSKGENA